MADRVIRAAKPANKTAEQTDGAASPAAPRFLGERPTRVYELAFPMVFGDVEYHIATFRRPSGVDFNSISERVAQGHNQTSVLNSIVTDLPVEVVDALDAEDYAAISEIAPDFIPARFKTAATPPASKNGQDTQA